MLGSHTAIVTKCDSRADSGACPCSCYSATAGSHFWRRLSLLCVHTRGAADYLIRNAIRVKFRCQQVYNAIKGWQLYMASPTKIAVPTHVVHVNTEPNAFEQKTRMICKKKRFQILLQTVEYHFHTWQYFLHVTEGFSMLTGSIFGYMMSISLFDTSVCKSESIHLHFYMQGCGKVLFWKPAQQLGYLFQPLVSWYKALNPVGKLGFDQ